MSFRETVRLVPSPIPGAFGQLDRVFVLRGYGQREPLFGQGVRETQKYGRLGVEFIEAQSLLDLITHIGMEALHHLAHKLLGAELQDFVGDVHFIDDVVETVQSRGGGFVGRVLDDDGRRTVVDERRTGVVEPCDPDAYGDRQGEPSPFGDKVYDQVHQVETLIVPSG